MIFNVVCIKIYVIKIHRMPTFRSRSWCVTLWKEFKFRSEFCDDDVKNFHVKYIHIGAEEKCPETKRLHHHAVAQFTTKVTMTRVKLLFGQSQAHCERKKGTWRQALDYCDKEGPPVATFGDTPCQGSRADLRAMRDHFQAGGSLREGIESDLCTVILKHPRAAQLLKNMFTPPRSVMTEIHILWGPTGTGKSHRAYEESKALGEVYFKPSGPWWDGYEQQPCVILEDFRGEVSLAQMLRLGDKYPLRVPVKGGFEQFTSKRIYITSNVPYCDFWNCEQKGYDASMEAFKRRITVEEELTEQYVPE